MITKMRAAAVALLAGSLIAGCGVALNSGAMRGQDGGYGGQSQEAVLEREAQSLGLPATGMGGSPHQFLRRGAAKLGLTAEQKAEFKKIAKAHAADRGEHKADFKKHHAELKALLLADKVDEAALRAFLVARMQEVSAKAAAGADTAAEMRAVLTEKQRADLVAMLQDQAHKKDFQAHHDKMEQRMKPRIEEFKKSLNLSAEQSAAVEALKAKMLASRKDAQPQMKQAAIAFIQTGDKAALVKGLQDGIAGHVPTEELVRVATVLDRNQRTRVAEHFGKAGKDMKKRHRGHFKGDHGFLGGGGQV